MSGNTILLNDPTRNWAFTTNYINGTYGNGIIIDASGVINSNLITFRTNGNARVTISDASFSVQNNLVVSGNTSLQSLRSTTRVVSGNLITSNINVSLANPVRPDVSYNYSVINLANTFTDLSNNYSGNAYNGQIGYLLSTNSLYSYQGFSPTGSWSQLYNYVPQKMLITYTGNALTNVYLDVNSGLNYRWVSWTNTTPPTIGNPGGTNVTASAITITQLSNIPGYNNIDFLIVGGGGGGGCGWQGGGGGAGGMISSTASLGISGGYGLNPGPFTATSLGSYNVGVGGGGPGAVYGPPTAFRSYSGGSSYITFPGYTSYTSPIQNSVGNFVQSQPFLIPTTFTWTTGPCSNYVVPSNTTALTAFGGGGGSGELGNTPYTIPPSVSPQPGGCGGAGSHGGSVPYENGVSPYPYQTYMQGFGGGNGFSGYQTSPSAGYVGPFIGGGGGGAGTPGMDASAISTTNGTGGNGGSGLANTITGSAIVYAGGGGGSCRSNITTPVAGSGGSGGGGNGVSVSGSTYPGSNASGYGCGGGAGSSQSASGTTAVPSGPAGQVGGNGSGGIVIIRWII